MTSAKGLSLFPELGTGGQSQKIVADVLLLGAHLVVIDTTWLVTTK